MRSKLLLAGKNDEKRDFFFIVKKWLVSRSLGLGVFRSDLFAS